MIGIKLDCDKCGKLVAAFGIDDDHPDQPDENDWYHVQVDLTVIKFDCPHRHP